jgi:hypothetical protein
MKFFKAYNLHDDADVVPEKEPLTSGHNNMS